MLRDIAPAAAGPRAQGLIGASGFNRCTNTSQDTSRTWTAAEAESSTLTITRANSAKIAHPAERSGRDERGHPGLLQLLQHTTGIHFDKHSLRWKATWYDNSGQRKAKYFPIGEVLEGAGSSRPWIYWHSSQ